MSRKFRVPIPKHMGNGYVDFETPAEKAGKVEKFTQRDIAILQTEVEEALAGVWSPTKVLKIQEQVIQETLAAMRAKRRNFVEDENPNAHRASSAEQSQAASATTQAGEKPPGSASKDDDEDDLNGGPCLL